MYTDGDDSLFFMDPRTARVYSRGHLDFETQADYVLTIQVTDDGLPKRRSSTTLLNIHVKDVNDNPPVRFVVCFLELFRAQCRRVIITIEQ